VPFQFLSVVYQITVIVICKDDEQHHIVKSMIVRQPF